MGRESGWKSYAATLVIVAACTVAAALMQLHFDAANLTMIYLLGVVVAAIAFGRGPAVLAAVLSVAVFDFAFVPPRYTFQVSDAQYLVVFAVMLAVAVITGTLTARLREQREASRLRERRTAALYRLSHDLAVRSTAKDILQATVDRIADLLGARVAAIVPGAGGALGVAAGDAGLLEADPERAAAEWAFGNAQPAGVLSGIPAGSRGAYLPLISRTTVLGVLAVMANDRHRLEELDRFELLRALSSQTALALERCKLAEDAERIRTEVEAERARNALLSSVSHDLRTPLAAITGAATSLRDSDGSMPERARRELAETISDEANRLNRLIGNLLDMTRLASGPIGVNKDWHSLEEVVGAALTRLEPELLGRSVRVAPMGEIPLVPMDDVLFETVLRNLIENAHKYALPGTPIEVTGSLEGEELRLDVADRGVGLAAGEERRVFEKFYRGRASSGSPGAGLGLAICKGIVEAHGGTIEAASRPGGGALFTVRLPLVGDPPEIEPESFLDARSEECS